MKGVNVGHAVNALTLIFHSDSASGRGKKQATPQTPRDKASQTDIHALTFATVCTEAVAC